MDITLSRLYVKFSFAKLAHLTYRICGIHNRDAITQSEFDMGFFSVVRPTTLTRAHTEKSKLHRFCSLFYDPINRMSDSPLIIAISLLVAPQKPPFRTNVPVLVRCRHADHHTPPYPAQNTPQAIHFAGPVTYIRRKCPYIHVSYHYWQNFD